MILAIEYDDDTKELMKECEHLFQEKFDFVRKRKVKIHKMKFGF